MYSAVLMLALTAGAETVDCHGCRGGCYGGGCYGGGCYGVSYGGCYGGCYGGGHNRGHGCRGGCNGCYGSSYGGCYGGGYGGCYGGGCYGGGVIYQDGVIVNPGQPKTMPQVVPAPKKTTQTSAPATILVSVPNGATLTVDGTPTKSTAATRTLVTPDLDFGSSYVYTLRAEVVNNGQSAVETQTVTVRGGETSRVQFNFSSQGVASR